MKKDFLSLLDLTQGELTELFSVTDALKSGSGYKPLEGKSAALIFQKPSLRTRVSFEVGVHQFGGHPVFLSNESVGIGTREKPSDVAKLLSRFTSLIIARLFDHSILLELAEHATVPVINALTDYSHPCQIAADLYTLRQHHKLSPGVKIVFVGDGNNVVNSWLEAAMLYPMHFVLAAPKGYWPDEKLVAKAKTAGISTIEIIEDPREAVRNADALYTDVWTSMGQEDESAARLKAFAGYRIDGQLLSLAKKDCVVLHCLPAHRGEEITEEVLEGEHSVVFDEAENRLHVQKAIIAMLFGYSSTRRSRGQMESSILVNS